MLLSLALFRLLPAFMAYFESDLAVFISKSLVKMSRSSTNFYDVGEAKRWSSEPLLRLFSTECHKPIIFSGWHQILDERVHSCSESSGS